MLSLIDHKATEARHPPLIIAHGLFGSARNATKSRSKVLPNPCPPARRVVPDK